MGTSRSKALTHLGKGRPATRGLCAACKLAERIHLMVATLSDGHGSSPLRHGKTDVSVSGESPALNVGKEFSMLPLVTAGWAGSIQPSTSLFLGGSGTQTPQLWSNNTELWGIGEDSWRATVLSFCVMACLLGGRPQEGS